ncbi:MAG: deoxynucleoside kinase [Oscillospiraceae bacterium]|nr:deoxynucleoside kinase [Oscillospiraceae bacterium]
MGRLVVIEGLDGSGKTTQSEFLYKWLINKGEKARLISFPDYENPSSALVRMYLGGEFGDNPDDVNAYAASSFYAVDRYASYKKHWARDYENGAFIIANRYVESNAYHQLSKVDDNIKDSYLNWLYDFEYNKLGIPKPDMVIYLDVKTEVSQRLITSRYSGDENKKDIHEKNVEYLKKCGESAKYAAEKLGWIIIDCCVGDEMLSADEIFEKIKKALIDKNILG